MVIENIADLHFGKIPNEEEMYESLKKNFIQRCIDRHADIIFINGDSYDSRQLINSKANVYYYKFIDDCIATGATIVVIEGTESHDRYQINSLLHYSSDKFFIVNSVKHLTINGLKFLLIPEEYVTSKDFYKDYLGVPVDFVQFHGMFSHVGMAGAGDEVVRKPFIWDWKMFDGWVKYYVIGGHIHTHSEYHNVIYCSSYSRLNFGEEEPKGWVEVEIDDVTGKANWQFLENKDAPLFTSVLASKLPNDTENLLNQLRGYQECNDYLRIIIDIDDESKKNTIVGFVKNHDNCCIKLNRSKKDDKEKEQVTQSIKEKQAALKEKMDDFRGLSFIEITQKIAMKDYHENFSQEEINKVLNTQL